jgi:hypothetical protein
VRIGMPRSSDRATAPQRGPDGQRSGGRYETGRVPYYPRHDLRIPASEVAQDPWRERQLAGLDALMDLAQVVNLAQSASTTQGFPAVSPTRSTRPRTSAAESGIRTFFRDPALWGAAALMSSAGVSGILALAFWSMTAHRQHAAGLGSVSAEVSAIMFLANVGSLNLINVFARFLPEAGWFARRLILSSYGAAAGVGLLGVAIFFLTPIAGTLVPRDPASRFGFAMCVVLNTIFMIQDGALVGFGRYTWVPLENVFVALARLALLPLTAVSLSAHSGTLWSWALPTGVAVVVVNALIIGRLAGKRRKQRSRLPTVAELGRFIAIDSSTSAVAAAVTAFLPALVTRRLGSIQGGYFYVPWMIATMVSLPLQSILISMVREAVARPGQADATIRRSLKIVLLVVIVAMAACLFLPNLILKPLGSDFVSHGVPLLRWVGLSVPAVAVTLLFWSTCLVRRRPWPVFAVNVATTGAIIGGVMSLGRGSDSSSVGLIFCVVEWAIAVMISFPTFKALHAIRLGHHELS